MIKHIEALRQDADAKANKVTLLQERVKRLRILAISLFVLFIGMSGVAYTAIYNNVVIQDKNEALTLRVSELEGLKCNTL